VNRHALVYAASSGLGYSSALQLARAGCRVTLVARPTPKLDGAVQRLSAQVPGAAVKGIGCDLSQTGDISAMWKRVEAVAPVDILVTNAGGPPPGEFANLTDEQWDGAYRSLLLSVVHSFRLAIPGMASRGWGRIVTITSTSGKEPLPGLVLSNVFRAGLAALVKSVAQEVASQGITVNNVAPGLTDTDRLGELFAVRAKKSGRTPEEERAVSQATVPRKKLNEPDEFGAAVAFLCSEGASGVSGITMFVDGAASRSTF